MTSNRGKLPIEPLSNTAWNRIREETFAELDSPVTEAPSSAPEPKVVRLRYALVAAALLASCLATFLVLRPKEPALLVAAVSRIATEGNVVRATVGDASLEVAPDSELVSSGSDASGWTVLMERGKVVFLVPKREQRPAFRVLAGSVAIEVVGTKFTVERELATVRVSVEAGTVRVTSGAESHILGQGRRWTNTSNTAPIGQPSALLEAPPAPASSNAAPAPSAPREPSRRERYETASRLEALDPNRAVALYLGLASGADAWAANALYAAGRLELERGRKAQARAVLEKYRARFPGGPNAEEARVLLERMD